MTHYIERRDAKAKANGSAGGRRKQMQVRPEPKLQA